ncbi:M48 family metalloprotease [Kribbella sp. NBC_01245]|uniref:M48 family metalloprotease n=1 Tax=Kribbella sp. NBC_01245 TaxID=2903578 RepID=UPI002E2E1B3F|nr:M48 family metalloprotease [Kribbella sp. NBC_01245]
MLPPLPRRSGGFEASGWTDLWLALPWALWSYLALTAVFGLVVDLDETPTLSMVIALWIVSGLAVLHPRTEDLIARWVYRLRDLTVKEELAVRPAWQEVCATAGVDPSAYRLWIYEGQQVTAPATAGRTVAVTSWAVEELPPRPLRAVLAHELGHHLGTPPRWSVLVLWYSIPARLAAVAIQRGVPALRQFPAVAIAALVFLTTALVGLMFYVFFLDVGAASLLLMLSPLAGPPILGLAGRAAERFADRKAADLGYGNQLQDVFYGWMRQARTSGTTPGVITTPVDPSIPRRLTALEGHLGDVAYLPFGGRPGAP